jgi:altronate dehydratase small subunit
MVTCFQIDPSDNVATMLADAAGGLVSLRGTQNEETITLREAIARGHKVALRTIQPGEIILKYGVVIGEATQAITVGEWVHLHNCRSRVDVRSAKLDLQTGLSEDVPYV